jgi:peroxiredoxin Q/BCP
MATTKKTASKSAPAKAASTPAPKAAAPKKAAPAAKPAPTPSAAPTEGQKAPAFSLEGSDGKTHRLADYADKNVILYFYPRDDTPGCTREAIAFQGAAKALAKKNAVVLGVSKDSLAAHAKFKAKYDLDFVLLSDPDLKVHAAYGAYGEKVLYGKKSMGVIRSTFVIGTDGRIKKAFPKVKVDGHDAQVLAAL